MSVRQEFVDCDLSKSNNGCDLDGVHTHLRRPQSGAVFLLWRIPSGAEALGFGGCLRHE